VADAAPARGGSYTSLPWDDVPYPAPGAAAATPVAEPEPVSQGAQDAPQDGAFPVAGGTGTWDGFVQYCAERNGEGGSSLSMLRQTQGRFADGTLTVSTRSSTLYNQISVPGNEALLTARARAYFGTDVRVEVLAPTTRIKTPSELRAEAERHPAVSLLREQFGATMLSCRPLADGRLQ